MALLWVEGCENFGTTIDAAPTPAGVVMRKYAGTPSEAVMLIKSGRLGGLSLRCHSTGSYMQPANLTTNATMILGVALYIEVIGNGNHQAIAFYDETTLGINIRIKTDGEIKLLRGSTLLATTSGLGLTTAAWYYIELKVLCNTTVGTYELKVDGITVLSATGANTQAGGHAYHTTFRLGQYDAQGGIERFDDIYCLDGSGSVNNDFLGNKRVATIRPNEAGDSAQFTPSAGNNYECVDEVVSDDNTTYVEDSVSGEKDLYGYGAVEASGLISGVMICTDCRETDASSFTLKTLCKSGNVESEDAGQAVGSIDFVTKKRIVENNPNTDSVWTAAALNVAQFGAKVG
jgi:hypothetical protein